jgi:threonine dehydrogenase-like Zn-dependent dehydrogenase
MKALVVVEETVEILDQPTPMPRQGEVIVKVHSCGICGSDVHAVEWGAVRPGQILGHEFAGTVAEPGPGVTGWPVGQPVAVNPLGTCGACEWCARELSLRCQYTPNLGLNAPGGFAEYVAVPASQLVAIPEGMSLEEGAHLEPLAVAIRAIKEADLAPGDNVLVFGAGPIGLSVIMAARASGAGKIVATEISSTRKLAARAVGADDVLDPREVDLAAYAKDAGIPFTRAIECSGAPSALGTCVQVLRGPGTIVQVALGKTPSPLSTNQFVSKNLCLASATGFGPSDYARSLDLIQSRAVDIQPLISERVPLSAAPEAFGRLRNPDAAVGILVQPWL